MTLPDDRVRLDEVERPQTNTHYTKPQHTMFQSIVSKLSTKQLAALTTAAEDTAFDILNVRECQSVALHEMASVTLADIADSYLNDVVTQFDINVVKVYNVMLSLLKDGILEEPMKIGYLNVEVDKEAGTITVLSPEFILTSGRHRMTALISLAELLDVDYGAFISQEVDVLSGIYNHRSILTANGSRSMTPAEKASIAVAASGIDPSNVEELVEAITSKSVGSSGIGLLFTAIARIQGTDLEPTTLAAIGKSIYVQLSRGSDYGMKRALLNGDFLLRVMEVAAANLATVITSSGVTNIAREYATVSTLLVNKTLKGDDEIKQYIAALEPAPKKAKAPAKAKAVSSTRNQPKAAAPHPAEISIESEVEQPATVEAVTVPTVKAPRKARSSKK